jgi:hypothetical protein
MEDNLQPNRWAKQLAGMPLWARKFKKRLPVILNTSPTNRSALIPKNGDVLTTFQPFIYIFAT